MTLGSSCWWCLPWCAGWASAELLGGHYPDLPRPPNTRTVAAIAAALLPMLATPPAHMFAATNMLVCVLLLLHFCAELLFSLCVSRSGRLRSCRGRGLCHANGGCGGQLDPCEMPISLGRTSLLRAYKQFLLSQGKPFCGSSAGADCYVSVTIVSRSFRQTCGGRRNHANYPVPVDSRRRQLAWRCLGQKI